MARHHPPPPRLGNQLLADDGNGVQDRKAKRPITASRICWWWVHRSVYWRATSSQFGTGPRRIQETNSSTGREVAVPASREQVDVAAQQM